MYRLRLIRRVPLAAAVALAVAATSTAASASSPTETIKLWPTAHSGVAGTAIAGARGNGTHVVFSVRGLSPNTVVRAVMKAGTCARPGASFATVGGATADRRGVAHWSANVLFRGRQVAWRTVADGGHLFQIIARSRVVACGVIPGIS